MRFHGAVGYANSEETAPGVVEEIITERTYSGDVFRDIGRRVDSPAVPGMLNPDVRIDNNISIVADAYAYENILQMRYVNWNGHNWIVSSVEVRRPRLILSIGGLWNGNTT
jgi:hypothetical protein